MPYTLAHPGFTLPLKKKYASFFSTTGLVFGSIAPDFDIILRFSNQRMHIFQYGLHEILFLILPIAVASAIYFHLVIKNILIDYAPAPLREDLVKYKNQNILKNSAANWIRLVASALLAIFMHLGLDLLSHYDAFTFQINAMLYYQSLIIGYIVYYFAMYFPPLFFTGIGFYLLYYSIKKENIKTPQILQWTQNTYTRNFLLVYIVITIIFAAIKIGISGIEKKFMIDSVAISLTNGFLISFFATPSIFAILNRIRKQRG